MEGFLALSARPRKSGQVREKTNSYTKIEYVMLMLDFNTVASQNQSVCKAVTKKYF